MSMTLQGSDQTRHLVLLKVPDLAARLRAGLAVEHIHDY